MEGVKEGTLLWKPDEQRIKQSNLYQYINWLKKEKGLSFDDYHSLWEWSVRDLEAFWESQWEYFSISATQSYDAILTSRDMPGTKWFPGAAINYTEHIFRNRDINKPAIIHASEHRATQEMTWGQLYKDTAALQQTLKKLGVQRGDRIVAYMPNIYETVVAFLAAASLGAIWSSASPDFGTQSVIDRFKQIEPKVMITIDGYSYNGKNFDRMQVAANIQEALPTIEATITIPYLNEQADFSKLKKQFNGQRQLQIVVVET